MNIVSYSPFGIFRLVASFFQAAKGWGYGSVVQHLSSVCEAFILRPSVTTRKREAGWTEGVGRKEGRKGREGRREGEKQGKGREEKGEKRRGGREVKGEEGLGW